MNEVSDPQPETFGWIFYDTIKRSWDRFRAWLTGCGYLYWINGKAGSGKSTLIKFIASDPRTRDLLQHSSPENEIMIVSFYLWLSGSKLQRSPKGFLCSIVRQIMLNDSNLLERLINQNETLLAKRCTVDWSIGEVSGVLKKAISITSRTICIFVDGLDEFHQDDDIDTLLDVVEGFSESTNVKVCVSGRPENYLVSRSARYPKIRLQDLTANDIESCIRDGLEKARVNCRPASISVEHFENIVKSMIDKADGVFLWIHYALSSLIRGIKNEDDFNHLQHRTDELPSGMQQLYRQMWKWLNGDQQRYRDEAATYFSYSEYFSGMNNDHPLSVFEMLVALDDPLQHSYIKFIKAQDPTIIAKRGQKLKTSILTRCAGLLEFAYSRDVEMDGAGSSNGTKNDINAKPPEISLVPYYHTCLKYIHRTAADFLKNEKEGAEILGNTQISADSRSRNVLRAEMAALVQKPDKLDAYDVYSLIKRIGVSKSPNEIDLLTDLKQICTKLSVPASPENHIAYRKFWRYYNEMHVDFEGAAAGAGCTDYVRHVVESGYSKRYYLRYVFLCAAASHRGFESKRLSLMSWLISQGADIFTKHCPTGDIRVPVIECLTSLIAPNITDNNRLLQQAYELTQQILPLLNNKSASDCLVYLTRANDWQVINNKTHQNTVGQHLDLVINISIVRVYYLIIHKLESHSLPATRWW